MKIFQRLWGVLGLVAAFSLGSAGLSHAGALYDLDIFLGQGHPFDAAPAAAQAVPATQNPVQPLTPAASAEPPPEPAPEMASATDEGRFGMRSDGNAGMWGISEVRGGILQHDEGPFSRNKEEGPDINVELLFVSPEFLDTIWSPRPHIGADINTQDDTSSYYLGLSWEWFLWRDMFAGFSLGGAYHDGETGLAGRSDKKELGCSVLFRESVEIGWLVADRHSLSFMLDHISNAKLCDQNEGLENFGFRYGYRL